MSVPGKVFTDIILWRLQPLLHRQQHPQQSGFTAGHSMVDAILALWHLSQLHRKQYGRLFRVSICRRSQSVGSLIKDLRTWTKSCVWVGRSCTASFPTSSGVLQGCALAPICFALPLAGSCPYVQTRQVSMTDRPCSQTLTMQMMQSCLLRTTFSVRPSLNHSILLETLWASTHPGQKLKFKLLPLDLCHLSVPSPPFCVISGHKWKWSLGLHISAVMLTHQKFSGGLA